MKQQIFSIIQEPTWKMSSKRGGFFTNWFIFGYSSRRLNNVYGIGHLLDQCFPTFERTCKMLTLKTTFQCKDVHKFDLFGSSTCCFCWESLITSGGCLGHDVIFMWWRFLNFHAVTVADFDAGGCKFWCGGCTLCKMFMLWRYFSCDDGCSFNAVTVVEFDASGCRFWCGDCRYAVTVADFDVVTADIRWTLQILIRWQQICGGGCRFWCGDFRFHAVYLRHLVSLCVSWHLSEQYFAPQLGHDWWDVKPHTAQNRRAGNLQK